MMLRMINAPGGIARGLCACFALAALACGDRTGTSATVSDSAGVRVVRTPLPREPLAAPVSISEEPIFSVGAQSSDARYDLVEFRGVRRLASGELAVADGNPVSVRLYDSTGMYVRELAASTEAGGLIADLQYLGSYADTLVVCCGPQLLFINRDGALIGKTAESRLPPTLLLTDGSWIERKGRDPSEYYSRQREVMILKLVDSLYRVSRDDTARQLVGGFVRSEQLYVFDPANPIGQTVVDMGTPFLPVSDVGTANGMLYYTNGRELGAEVYDMSGRKTLAFGIVAEPRAITDEMRSMYQREVLGLVKDSAYVPYVRSLFPHLPPITGVPWVAEMHVGDDGMTWLRQKEYPARDISTWHVFREDGTYAGSVQLSTALRIQQIGHNFMITARPRFDRGSVVEVHRLTWSDSAR